MARGKTLVIAFIRSFPTNQIFQAFDRFLRTDDGQSIGGEPAPWKLAISTIDWRKHRGCCRAQQKAVAEMIAGVGGSLLVAKERRLVRRPVCNVIVQTCYSEGNCTGCRQPCRRIDRGPISGVEGMIATG